MSVSAPPNVTVRVLLFASYAEALGREALSLTLAAPATVQAVLARLRALPGGERLPAQPLCAVNLAHSRPDTPLAEGDEVAVLPPMAGG
ncbi:MAG TPA: MoaD/ThiS family protein [Gemmatimonadales bacterium]|jgi:molybdopterin synthase catalytic subunit|nr:MoaD/ThiS family protein [Gemmatimonadales bacterium]